MKRFVDLSLSLVAFLFLSPFFILIALTVLCLLGRPIFFIQERIGLDNKPFKLIKFRTMTLDLLEGGQITDSQRTTSFGRFLRSSSLDELPELFNIVLGQMSLVGPRPLLPKYLIHYDAIQIRRHEVRPGLTGWAQINGRNSISWEDRLELDVWYVDNRSLILDVKIMLLTLVRVFQMHGVDTKDGFTMTEFQGTKRDE